MDMGLFGQQSYKSHSRSGFSLVIALSLMAFVLLLILTITSLVKVETGAAGGHLEIQKAREGARLALSMAIGELQKYAGHDERATARADITGATTTGATHWTGVWDTDSSSTSPIAWLVSGTNPVPTDALNANNSLELVGDDTVDNSNNYVKAPVVNIFDANGNVSSRIAWWVSDEGLKASVAQLPLEKRSNRPSFTPVESMDALHTMLVTTHGLEEIFENYDRFDASDAPEIDRVTSIEQLVNQEGFQKNTDGTGWDFDYVDENGTSITEEAFHALTPVSYGLLASTEPSIGLMQDLSRFPDSLGLGTEFAHYMNRGVNAAAAKSGQGEGSVAAMRQTVGIRGLESTGSLSDGAVASLATPILTNFMMAFAVYESATLLNPQVRMHFFSEFWNPYTSTLAMNDGTDDYELELEITGLPTTIRVRLLGGGGVGGDIDLQDLLGSTDPGNVDPGKPVVIRLAYNQDEAWHPGMTKNWTGVTGATGPSPYLSNQTLTKDWVSGAFTLGGDVGIPTVVANIHTDATNDRFQIFSAGPPNDINVAVYLVNVNTGVKTLLTQNEMQYSNVNVPLDNTTGFTIGTITPTFGYQFILKGPHHGNSDITYGRGLWLSENDPRSPNAYVPTYDGLAAQNLVPSPNPNSMDLVDLDPENQIERPERLFNRSDMISGDHYKLWQESPLFELPRERILSLASLQHLYFHNERPFKVGNSWGDDGSKDTLQWFDRYFFSGISPSDTLSNFTRYNGFPNPILVLYNYRDDPAVFEVSPQSQSVSRNALVAGRFNLNSTSVSAWKAVLGGLRIDDWPYLDYYPGNDLSDTRASPDPDPLLDEIQSSDRVSRGAMFTRFPSTLHETYDVFDTPVGSTTTAPSEFYRRGVRYLTPQQVEAMAVSIVSQIKERGSPFFLVKDFLNNPNSSTGSILEEAIQASVFTDSVSGRQQWDRSWEKNGVVNDDSDRIDIDHFSPGFLTQADIMTAIGPMLAPRSDTFKIRARCQTFSPFDPNEIVGDATIEAVVQRVPDPFDSNDINDSIQRKFEVLSVRWLTVDEL